MAAKICPRCGNLYEDLKSKTCPNCFAVLEPIDRETAQAVARARAEVEESPEWQAVKAAEDERWRQQSFGACLGVVGIFLATVVLSFVLIAVAARRQRPHPLPAVTRTAPTPSTQAILSPTPAANAALEEVMPARIGPFVRTLRETVPLPGLSSSAFHAAYELNGDPLRTVEVFAFLNARPPAEQNEFASSVAFAARLQKQAQPPQPFLTQSWRYAVLGPATSDFLLALAQQFHGS